MSPVLDRFHPLVRAWFERCFDAPSLAQERGWPVIARAERPPCHDVLVCAPTGSGKTLAAFLWAIDRLVVQSERGALADEVSILYVSPLRALANDIRLNLERPLEGICALALEQGLAIGAIRAGLRTGDTPAGERAAMLRRAPHILVTTPESLFILLTSPRFRSRLAAVRCVIVDELHALAGDKRGAHLALTLERLERMVREAGRPRPVRIGLSATLNPIEHLAQFLAGAEVSARGERTRRPVAIVRADDRARAMDVQVLAPGPDLGPLATHQHWEAMYDEAARLIRAHRTTLVFTLSRRWAERVALNLQKRLGAGAVMAHHGSLARKERLDAEQRLKRGELKAIVATASLELGIDVGAVELVIQIDSPKSISAAIQRIGRSGHTPGATAKGRFIALTLDDLVECAACARALRAGRLDEVEIPMGCLDVAAQQIVAIAAEEEEVGEDELLRLLRRAYNFAALDSQALDRLLAQMAAEPRARVSGAAPRIFYDPRNRRVRARRGARLCAITSGGTIPESGNYDVIVESQGRKVGDVEEDFAQESSRGDIFALGSMPWRIERVSRGRLMVEAAPGMAPTLPFWQTEAAGRSAALSRETWELRREIAARLANGGEADAVHLLVSQCMMDEGAAHQATGYVRRAVAVLGAIPDDRTIVVERFFDGLGGTQVVIHAPFGIRFNRALGLALRKRLCQTFDFEIQASAIDDACLLALNARHSFALGEVLRMVSARRARAVLIQALLDAPMFAVRFRHVATRALWLARWARGRKLPAYLQRLRADDLLAAIFPGQQACFENRPPVVPIPDHFIVAETVREMVEESCDAAGMERVLRGIEDGAIGVVAVDAISPSPFAHRILLAWDYSFLDGGERANRRSRTVRINRAMAEEVMRCEDLSAMLPGDVVEAVAAEAAGLAPKRMARNPDELLDLIRAHGGLPGEGLGVFARGDARAMVETLRRERRVVTITPREGARALIVAAEDAPLYQAAYPEATVDGTRKQDADGRDGDAARDEIVRRTLGTCAPATVGELSRRLYMAASDVAHALARLEVSGAVFRGHFTSRAEEQWCDRYLLERIHRATLARIRAEIEPCEDHEYAAFVLRWHHIGGVGLESGERGVAAVLDQLSGLAFPPEVWERAILPARVPGYRPEYLDSLCLGGRFAWVGDGTQGGTAMVPAKVGFINRRAMWPWQAVEEEEPDDPRELAVWRALVEGGAQYLDQVAERADLSERDALAALWRLAARGRVSNDSFAPLRLFAAAPDAARLVAPRAIHIASRREAALSARLKAGLAGRWSAVAPSVRARKAGAFDPPREMAILLLKRHGVVAREVMAVEPPAMGWNDVLPALRRLEYAGTVRRGWFVRSLSGEQYAWPEAAEMLRAIRGAAAGGKPAALSAADPANPYGAMLKGCAVAREASNVVVLRGGRVVLALGARSMATLDAPEGEEFAAALGALVSMRARTVIETIDGRPALNSPRVAAMAAMGFHSDGRALVFDGLPGPTPLGARAPAS